MPTLENQKILAVDGKEFTIRWRGLIDQPGPQTMGHCYTGTINEYRLPHLHKSVNDLLFCGWEIAKDSLEHPHWMHDNLGRPEDIEAFLR